MPKPLQGLPWKQTYPRAVFQSSVPIPSMISSRAIGNNQMINERQLKEQICEIGRRVYAKGFAAANDGNISIRVADNEVLCTPTMVSKGFLKPEDICKCDLNGKQLAGTRKRSSELLLHLAVYKERPDVKAV